jgi:hypothetical protein
MFVLIGSCLAGIYLILRDLFPYLKAQSTGVIETTGYKRRRILRSEEPGRFQTLCRNRIDGMIIGLLAVGFGIGWALFGLLALILILPIGAIITMIAKRSTKNAKRVSEEFS